MVNHFHINLFKPPSTKLEKIFTIQNYTHILRTSLNPTINLNNGSYKNLATPTKLRTSDVTEFSWWSIYQIHIFKLSENKFFGIFQLLFCLDIRLNMIEQSYKAKKNKLYVSKLPRAIVFRCAFDSAKFKLLIFFFCFLIFFQFLWTCLSNYRWKVHNRHNKTLWTTDFFNSVFCLVSCSSKNEVPYFILNKVVTDSNLKHLLLRGKKQKCLKKTAFRSGFQICHKLGDVHFLFFFSLTFIRYCRLQFYTNTVPQTWM